MKKSKIILFFKVTIPGTVEYLLRDSQSNFGLYGANLVIYHSRNLFYGFTCLSCVFYYFEFYKLSYYFFIFGFINHVFQYHEWHKLLFRSQY